MSNEIIRCYQDLANAIILQAAEDYEKSLCRLQKDPGQAMESRTLYECERFFRSGYYKELSDIDPDLILAEIHRRAEHDKRAGRKLPKYPQKA